MQYVLLISDMIQEINRIRHAFDKSFVIKATSSADSGLKLAQESQPSIIVYHIGSNFNSIFSFYKNIRTDDRLREIPLIIMADINILKSLVENVEMINTEIVGSAISQENMSEIIHKLTHTSAESGEKKEPEKV